MTLLNFPSKDESKKPPSTAVDKVLDAARQYAKALVKYGKDGGQVQKLLVRESMKALKIEVIKAIGNRQELCAVVAEVAVKYVVLEEHGDEIDGTAKQIAEKIREMPL